jgi:hypothetical protein
MAPTYFESINENVLYDFSNESFPIAGISIASLALVIAIIFILLVLPVLKSSEEKEMNIITAKLIVSVFCSCLLLSGGGSSYQYFDLKHIYDSGKYKKVSGRVENFRIIKSAHLREGFDVSSIPFQLSGNKGLLDYGYNQLGDMKDSLTVNIFYIGTDNKLILRMAIEPELPANTSDSIAI